MNNFKVNQFLLFYLISYGFVFLLFIDHDLHMPMGKLVFYSFLLAIPCALLMHACRKIPRRIERYFSKSQYRKMKEKRDREKIKVNKN